MSFKHLFALQLALFSCFYSLLAISEGVESSMAKVTIAVDGMMKSKSGAT